MIYDFICEKCSLEFEVIRPMKDAHLPVNCVKCGKEASRIWSSKVQFLGTKIEDREFNVGLGKITKSKKHRDELAKRMGLVEVGNEKPSTIHREMDATLKKKTSWDDV